MSEDIEIDEIFAKFIRYKISSKRFRTSYIAEVMNSSPQYVNSVLNRYTVKATGNQRGMTLRKADEFLRAVESNWKEFYSYLSKEYEIL